VIETPSLDLFAEDLGSSLEVEQLNDAALLGTWASFACFGSFSCPASTAASGGSFSSVG
jgi:hypothetical protein